jgi:TatD DNase family protein
MEKMLIETDSPYLSPDPLRGKSNEPANVKIVAENVALIKEISFEEVANLTTSNFKNFFFNDQKN